MEKKEQNVELTTISIVQQQNDVGSMACDDFQNADVFTWSAEDLSAPSASKKDSLFDWQFENDGAKSIDRFGGIDKLMTSLGTDPHKVCVRGSIHVIGTHFGASE